MYKDSSCRSSPQPPPPPTTTTVAEIASDTAAATLPQDIPPTHARAATLEDDEEDGFSCPTESSSDSEYEVRSRPSTTSTTSTSSSSAAAGPAVGAPYLRRQKRTTATTQRVHANTDVRLLRKIGYIASRVRFLAKIYNDFKLVNPYSPAKQKRLLQEILLKHSIIDPERELSKAESSKFRPAGTSSVRSLTPASSIASSYCCLPQTESSFEDDSVTGTVRRKSSTSVTTSASIVLLEDLLIQLYEDRRNKVTVIRRRRSRRSSAGATTTAGTSKIPRNHLIIMSSKTTSSSVERLLQLDNEDEGGGGGSGIIGVTCSESTERLTKGNHIYNANITTSSQQRSSTAFLQPIPGDENLKRRRASDCTPHPNQPFSNQLQITLKNNNCTKFPLHRGSCGAAGEHLLAANSIANRQTLILSKSCGNVDAGLGNSNPALYGSTDLRNLSTNTGGVSSVGGNGSVTTTTAGGGGGVAGVGAVQTNGNNEYSIVQLNNTIIQCHFNDEDFRALVKDLKRKVEYTERMNWLCKYHLIFIVHIYFY